ncbi:MAG: phosphotransferase [Candidatus Nanopelagicales bacterium]|nr:phosphotransferase [Candidatus Nanopelagicales bacterium]MDZ4249567.1 phosphotransferase [Candidatus Nanopelagicales bacterium]
MEPRPDDFARVCRRTLLSRGIAASGLRCDTRGSRHLVLLDPPNGLVYRFPYSEPDAAAIGDVAIRHRAAASLGLPAPRVIDVVTGGAGSAFLVLDYRPGLALDTPAARRLVSDNTAEVAVHLNGLLDRLRNVDAAGWPLPFTAWADLWGALPARLAVVVERIPQLAFSLMMEAAERATQVSLEAPLGLIHGDLGGVNVRIGDQAQLTSVLDWDGSVPGDTAVDTAALLFGIPDACRQRMLADSPDARAELDRFGAYRATWAAQGAIWSVENDRPDILDDVVQRQLMSSPAPHRLRESLT